MRFSLVFIPRIRPMMCHGLQKLKTGFEFVSRRDANPFTVRAFFRVSIDIKDLFVWLLFVEIPRTNEHDEGRPYLRDVIRNEHTSAMTSFRRLEPHFSLHRSPLHNTGRWKKASHHKANHSRRPTVRKELKGKPRKLRKIKTPLKPALRRTLQVGERIGSFTLSREGNELIMVGNPLFVNPLTKERAQRVEGAESGRISKPKAAGAFPESQSEAVGWSVPHRTRFPGFSKTESQGSIPANNGLMGTTTMTSSKETPTRVGSKLPDEEFLISAYPLKFHYHLPKSRYNETFVSGKNHNTPLQEESQQETKESNPQINNSYNEYQLNQRPPSRYGSKTEMETSVKEENLKSQHGNRNQASFHEPFKKITSIENVFNTSLGPKLHGLKPDQYNENGQQGIEMNRMNEAATNMANTNQPQEDEDYNNNYLVENNPQQELNRTVPKTWPNQKMAKPPGLGNARPGSSAEELLESNVKYANETQKPVWFGPKYHYIEQNETEVVAEDNGSQGDVYSGNPTPHPANDIKGQSLDIGNEKATTGLELNGAGITHPAIYPGSGNKAPNIGQGFEQASNGLDLSKPGATNPETQSIDQGNEEAATAPAFDETGETSPGVDHGSDSETQSIDQGNEEATNAQEPNETGLTSPGIDHGSNSETQSIDQGNEEATTAQEPNETLATSPGIDHGSNSETQSIDQGNEEAATAQEPNETLATSPGIDHGSNSETQSIDQGNEEAATAQEPNETGATSPDIDHGSNSETQSIDQGNEEAATAQEPNETGAKSPDIDHGSYSETQSIDQGNEEAATAQEPNETGATSPDIDRGSNSETQSIDQGQEEATAAQEPNETGATSPSIDHGSNSEAQSIDKGNEKEDGNESDLNVPPPIENPNTDADLDSLQNDAQPTDANGGQLEQAHQDFKENVSSSVNNFPETSLSDQPYVPVDEFGSPLYGNETGKASAYYVC